MAGAITEKNFQMAVRCGSVLLAVSIIANLYSVLRYREIYRDRVQAELRLRDPRVQQLVLQEQAFENVLREFISRAPSNPQIAEILRRYQVIGGAPSVMTNQEQGSKP